jgi:hypothetical protein
VTDDVGNLILERLRRMDDRLSNIEEDMHDMKLRMTVAEEHIGNLVLGISGLNARMDRFDERLTRVERRLELKSAN